MIEARAFRIDGILAPSTFRVEAGSFALLTGPTGSGKTLLLRALAGFREPRLAYGGDLLVDGRPALDPSALAPSVALVFQDASERLAHPDVGSALAFRLENLGLPAEATRRRVAEGLARSGLPPERPTWELSEGEAKRLALEAALLADPRVLLLDEPLAGLDPGARRRVLLRLAALHGRATVVVAEHRSAEVAPLADLRLDCAGGRVREVPPLHA